MSPESPPDRKARITLAQVRSRRDEILRLAAAHDARNVRVFGSVARGTADADSDVDFLVDIATEATGFAYFGLLGDLRRSLMSALGCEVEVVDSAGLDRLREQILREAVPL